MLSVKDIKEVTIPGNVLFKASMERGGSTFEVVGRYNERGQIVYKVWVQSGNKCTCVNPKNGKGEIAVYTTPQMAVSKANRVMLIMNRNNNGSSI